VDSVKQDERRDYVSTERARASLRSWDDVRQPVQIVAASERRRDGSRAGWWVTLALLAIAGAGAGGYVIGNNRPVKVRTEIVTITVPVTTVAPNTTTTVAAPTTTAAPVPVTTPVPTVPAAVPTTVPIPAGEVVRPTAAVTAGKLTLKGSQPTQEAIDALVLRANALVGAENVTNQYVVDPRVTFAVGGDVTIAEAIHFESGGSEPTAESKAVLDQVAAMMAKSPAAFVVANSYTDSQGDDLRNIGLAKQRVDAIATYWQDKGVPPDRVIPAARGKVDPVADNATAEGRAQNRRVVLVLHDLL
jgi:outer membrane protein OmpA-like peptidoglycan-associated protein